METHHLTPPQAVPDTAGQATSSYNAKRQGKIGQVCLESRVVLSHSVILSLTCFLPAEFL